MNLYVIRRPSGWRTPEELQAAAARSKQVGDDEMSADIRWIRSYVVHEADEKQQRGADKYSCEKPEVGRQGVARWQKHGLGENEHEDADRSRAQEHGNATQPRNRDLMNPPSSVRRVIELERMGAANYNRRDQQARADCERERGRQPDKNHEGFVRVNIRIPL
jgi:hypothetical protein